MVTTRRFLIDSALAPVNKEFNNLEIDELDSIKRLILVSRLQDQLFLGLVDAEHFFLREDGVDTRSWNAYETRHPAPIRPWQRTR